VQKICVWHFHKKKLLVQWLWPWLSLIDTSFKERWHWQEYKSIWHLLFTHEFAACCWSYKWKCTSWRWFIDSVPGFIQPLNQNLRYAWFRKLQVRHSLPFLFKHTKITIRRIWVRFHLEELESFMLYVNNYKLQFLYLFFSLVIFIFIFYLQFKFQASKTLDFI